MVRRLVGYVWDPVYGWVAPGDGEFPSVAPGRSGGSYLGLAHQAESKRQLHEAIQLSPLAPQLRGREPLPARQVDVLRVHSREHLDAVHTSSVSGTRGSAPAVSAPFIRGNYEIGLRSAGGAIEATRAVLDGEVDTAYALINPPGSHVGRDGGPDFSVFNNVSVAAAYARDARGVSRVAVIDLCASHGDGTQEIWWDEADVLTVSVHQERSYPACSGFREERGGGAGTGANLNVPLPPGSGNAVYEQALTEVVFPALTRFGPELILVAAGFGASVMDPFGRQMVTKRGFRQLTRHLLDAADQLCDGNIVFLQESGTNPSYLSICGIGMLEEMTGVDTGIGDPFAAYLDPQGVDEIADHQRRAVGAAAALVSDVPVRKSVSVGPGRSG